MPGVGMNAPRRYTASSASVNNTRLRRSGMRKMLASFSNMNSQFSVLSSQSLLLLCAGRRFHQFRRVGVDDLDLPARLGDLLRGRLGELVGVYGDGRLQLAVAQDLDA